MTKAKFNSAMFLLALEAHSVINRVAKGVMTPDEAHAAIRTERERIHKLVSKANNKTKGGK
jgi:hypothetical protein